MQLFYARRIEGGLAYFDEEESRHLRQVLRRQPGDRLQITDGCGGWYETELLEGEKKVAIARVMAQLPAPTAPSGLHIALAPTKQMERFEWFLEKATELGAAAFTPLNCQRSERAVVRLDRLEKITVSAMKQSLRAHLPTLAPLTPFKEVVSKATEAQKFIAWCAESPLPLLKSVAQPGGSALILIGPEGDFTPEEVAWAVQHGFTEVSLGTARLRTETAGVLAAALWSFEF